MALYADSFGAGYNDRNAPVPFGFGGGLRDAHTGLVYLIHRDYAPDLGHFIQPDPLGYAGGDVEIYGYCLDDPINLVDPLGLKTCMNARGGVPGHAWIDIGCNGGIGKYPEGWTDIVGGDAEYRKEKKGPDVTVEFQTSKEQESKMENEQWHQIEMNPNYNLSNDNCVTHANRVANAGGIGLNSPPSNVLPIDYINNLNEHQGGGGADVTTLDGKNINLIPLR